MRSRAAATLGALLALTNLGSTQAQPVEQFYRGKTSSWKTTKPDWLRDGKIFVIAQAGPRAPDLAAPSLEELARTEDERRILELVFAGSQFGRPFTTAPGTPEDRVAALRTAFDAVMNDPEFRTEMQALHFEVAPVAGAAREQIAAKVVSTPKELAARAKPFLE
jgi:hypothetical protein